MSLDGDYIALDIVRELMVTDFQQHCADVAAERGEPVPPPLLAVRDDPRPFAGVDVNGPSARIGPFDVTGLDGVEGSSEQATMSEVALVPIALADMTAGGDSQALARVMRIRKVALLRTFAPSARHPVYGVPPYQGRLRYRWVKAVGSPGLPIKATPAFWQAVGVQVRFQFIESL